jgi:hypothetical protein
VTNQQGTLQIGFGNTATTSQTSAFTGVNNSSVTAQFGFHNSATTIQH